VIGVLLVAHTHIASESKAAAEHILGKQPNFEALDITHSEAAEDEKIKLEALVQQLDTGEGVLILVDMYGATPWNITQAVCQGRKAEIISGFSLPTVIKAISKREEMTNLNTLAQKCVQAGQKYMQLVSETTDMVNAAHD